MSFASNAAKKRYADKTYGRYAPQLCKVEDAELIARIEALKAADLSATKKLIETAEDKMKTIIKLTQNAYAAGGFRRLATEDGKT